MDIRKTFTEKSPESVRVAFRDKFSYNSLTGEITNNRTKRLYHTQNVKKYRSSIYLVVDSVEYRILYHRLCWFLHYDEVVPDSMQIDHIDNIKDNNIINNLRLCNNATNAKKKLRRRDNTTGFKGVSNGTDTNKYGTIYHYFTASISVDNVIYKIGRFKDAQKAAEFYDSAARYYFKDYSVCNFDVEHIKPMSCIELRKLKKQEKL
jgi:hypothetical protein